MGKVQGRSVEGPGKVWGRSRESPGESLLKVQ